MSKPRISFQGLNNAPAVPPSPFLGFRLTAPPTFSVFNPPSRLGAKSPEKQRPSMASVESTRVIPLFTDLRPQAQADQLAARWESQPEYRAQAASSDDGQAPGIDRRNGAMTAQVPGPSHMENPFMRHGSPTPSSQWRRITSPILETPNPFTISPMRNTSSPLRERGLFGAQQQTQPQAQQNVYARPGSPTRREVPSGGRSSPPRTERRYSVDSQVGSVFRRPSSPDRSRSTVNHGAAKFRVVKAESKPPVAGHPYVEKVQWEGKLRGDESPPRSRRQSGFVPPFALKGEFRNDWRDTTPCRRDSTSPLRQRDGAQPSFHKLTKSAAARRSPALDHRDIQEGMWNLPASSNPDLVVKKHVNEFCRFVKNPTTHSVHAVFEHTLRESVNREVRKPSRGERKSHLILSKYQKLNSSEAVAMNGQPVP